MGGDNLVKNIQLLTEKRMSYGVSQSKLASAMGVTRQHLNAVEKGKKSASFEFLDKMDVALERFNPDCPLELLFDYVRIRFPTTNVQHIVEKILRIKLDYMAHETRAFYGYDETYYFRNITVMFSKADEKLGVLLELKGKGCRQFESFLSAQDRSWYEFFSD